MSKIWPVLSHSKMRRRKQERRITREVPKIGGDEYVKDVCLSALVSKQWSVKWPHRVCSIFLMMAHFYTACYQVCQLSHMINFIKHDQPNYMFSANRYPIPSDWSMADFTCSLFKRKESNEKLTCYSCPLNIFLFTVCTHMCYTLFKTLIWET